MAVLQDLIFANTQLQTVVIAMPYEGENQPGHVRFDPITKCVCDGVWGGILIHMLDQQATQLADIVLGVAIEAVVVQRIVGGFSNGLQLIPEMTTRLAAAGDDDVRKCFPWHGVPPHGVGGRIVA